MLLILMQLSLFAQTPTITSFTPASGPAGTLVTIAGTNLGSPTAFTIGSVTALVISNTGTQLVGFVMPGAATGTVSVTTAGGTATGPGNFTVTATPYPGTQQENKLGAGEGTPQTGQAVAVSADGNTAIAGGPQLSGTGGAWIFTRIGTSWLNPVTSLVVTGNIGNPLYGFSVAISADGNTAIVGGYSDNGSVGAAWVWSHSSGSWVMEQKLVGSGNIGQSKQGLAVSLSADGNTAIVGGGGDNSTNGAIWVWTRSGSTWTQQGNKLVGTGNSGAAQQGYSVALSADGNTFIEGGNQDNTNKGAAWVFTRSAGIWSQQAKLVGTGQTGTTPIRGTSVSISADGNTAAVGAIGDNFNRGAVWVWTRSAGIWSQQGFLVGSNSTGFARQGRSVSLSADGNTLIEGGYTDGDPTYIGAFWAFTRSGITWTQKGTKLIGSGYTGASQQGVFITLSADGSTSLLGGPLDNTGVGAAWVFIPSLPLPTITSFTPTSAGTGTTVTITGTNFTGATAVSFGGTAATSFSVVSATSITAVVAGGTSGSVSVTTPGGTATKTGFTFLAAPTITSFSPTSAAAGETVFIDGTNFSGTGITVSSVKFGGTAASSFTVSSATLMTAVVGSGATGSVSVTTGGGTATLAGFTFNTPPTITSFTPTSAATGATVTITGTNFSGTGITVSSVKFGGTAATSFTVVSATSITAVVASGSTGSVTVTTGFGTATKTGFTYLASATWTGTTSTYWNTSTNWSTNAVPTALVNATIPSAPSNQPIVNEAPGTPAVCKDLTIASGAVLTIAPGKALTVNGTLTNSAGTTGLIIQSSAAGTGSLKHNTAGVNATIQRYISGSATLTDLVYHLVSVPLTSGSSPTSNLFVGSYLYYFDETQVTPVDNGWVNMGTSTANALSETRGYMVYYPGANHTYSFAGSMNNGSFTATTSYTSGAAASNQGYNLIPNPYPSSIDWLASSGWTKTHTDDAIYVWNSFYYNYAYYVNGATANGGSQYISPGQAFFVHANAASPVLAMDNNVRVHYEVPFLKNNENIADLLKIHADAGTASDEIVIRFADGATTGFDGEWDAYKMIGGENAPQLSSLTADNINLAINSLPLSAEPVTVPLDFTLNSNSDVTFTASGMASFNPATTIYLEDKTLSKMVNLKAEPVYTFSYQRGSASDRFILHFNGVTGVQENTEAVSGRAFISNGRIYLDLPSMQGHLASITVYNAIGQVIRSQNQMINGISSIEAPLSTGVYIIHVATASQNFVTKVINK